MNSVLLTGLPCGEGLPTLSRRFEKAQRRFLSLSLSLFWFLFFLFGRHASVTLWSLIHTRRLRKASRERYRRILLRRACEGLEPMCRVSEFLKVQEWKLHGSRLIHV